MTVNTVIGKGKAHSKIILIGEHSVVYGYPAIAIPLKDINVRCEVTKSTSSFIYNSKDVISTAIKETLKYLDIKDSKIKYKINSEIPTKRGMGSSAAVSIAIIRAVYDYYKKKNINRNYQIDSKKTKKNYRKSIKKMNKYILEKIVHKSEKIAHNLPSGLDAKICLSNNAIKFIKDKGYEYLDINVGAYLIIADSGVYGKTKEAVEKVKSMKEKANPMLKNLGDYTLQMEKEIKLKNIKNMGKLMLKAHEELSKLGLSIEKTDLFVKASMENGALGSKISGGGLGGCVITLVDNLEKAKKIENILKEKGAVNIWIEKL